MIYISFQNRAKINIFKLSTGLGFCENMLTFSPHARITPTETQTCAPVKFLLAAAEPVSVCKHNILHYSYKYNIIFFI